MKLLLIEDDSRIVQFLQRGLKAEGHVVAVVQDGTEGLDQAEAGDWDAIVLDIMLPGKDGREICRTLRMNGNSTPILMLTALDTTEDVVQGLRLGANDYMAKPFAFDELLARLERLGNRDGVPAKTSSLLQVANLTFDRDALVVRRGGSTIELTSLEYALLEFLMVEAGKVVSRARILQNVWGASEDPLTNVVDVYIRRLRTKIDEGRTPPLIKTIRGRGYRLSAD